MTRNLALAALLLVAACGQHEEHNRCQPIEAEPKHRLHRQQRESVPSLDGQWLRGVDRWKARECGLA